MRKELVGFTRGHYQKGKKKTTTTIKRKKGVFLCLDLCEFGREIGTFGAPLMMLLFTAAKKKKKRKKKTRYIYIYVYLYTCICVVCMCVCVFLYEDTLYVLFQ